jgi:hypothetical protein
MKRLTVALMVVVAFALGWAIGLVRDTTAEAQTARMKTYTVVEKIPKNWGRLVSGNNSEFVFEAADGTVRSVTIRKGPAGASPWSLDDLAVWERQ